jgi:threonine dehydrogenase-like Zn-dependent dehydrogenase
MTGTMTRMMRSAIFYGGKEIRVEDRPVPELHADEVLVRIRAAGICGADLLGYHSSGPWQPPAGVGIEEGHELAGEVVDFGSQVHGLEVGQRVAVRPEHLIACGSCRECNLGMPHLCSRLGLLHGAPHASHGFSEYDAVLASHVHPIPASLSFDAAAIADCFGVAVHAIHRAGGVEGQTVAVIGSGTIGLCVGQAARALGAARVLMIGDKRNALQVALRTHAADHIVYAPEHDVAAAVATLTDDAGPTIVFEAVGRSETTLDQALRLVARGGKICILGTFTISPAFSPHLAYAKEASLLWSNSYGLHGTTSEFDETLELMAAGYLDAEGLITHRFPLERIAEAFAVCDNKARTHAIKVLVTS